MAPKRINTILEFDLVIVGAGSSGSVIAGSLAEKTNLSILVVEAGGNDFRPDIKVPIGYGMTFFNPKVNWCYVSTPQEHLNGRSLYVPRGKVLGGSASINAMVYLRGQKNDFDDWASFSSQDLGWDSVRSTYDAIEGIRDNLGKQKIHVSDVSKDHELMVQDFIQSGERLGFRQNLDLNGDSSEGIGHYPISTRNGMRWTASDGFLKPAMRLRNLTVFKNSQVTKLITANGRVTDIEFLQGKSKLKKVIWYWSWRGPKE